MRGTGVAALADLLLPTSCAGCGAERVPLRRGVCADCVAVIALLRPRETRPTPAPPGLPPCACLGDYADPLRSLVLAYKDRGRHRLAEPLGALLSVVVAEVAGGHPVLLVPVPDTARAARARHGDHMARLVRSTARRLVRDGVDARCAYPLKALDRRDSAHLSAAERADQAVNAFVVRASRFARVRSLARGRVVIAVDDVVTTGSTLAAVSHRLSEAGVQVAAGVTLAATILRLADTAGGVAVSAGR
ncbi:MAG: ComF family protein [Hamadaea sp.]|nr:ComF family protein [Hamadaea sp.]